MANSLDSHLVSLAMLTIKANEFLSSRAYTNNLPQIISTFEVHTFDYSPQLLTVEKIFEELIKRGDLILKPNADEAEVPQQPYGEYWQWLKDNYKVAWHNIIHCMKRGTLNSWMQALVTASNLMQVEGQYSWRHTQTYYFPVDRLRDIFGQLLDDSISTTLLINRFQEFCNYRDVQQNGLKVLYKYVCIERSETTPSFVQNVIQLCDRLLANDILYVQNESGNNEEEYVQADTMLCASTHKPAFVFEREEAKRYANYVWVRICNWARDEDTICRQTILLLIEKMMPILIDPLHALVAMCDCLNVAGPSSVMAIQGILELVRNNDLRYEFFYETLYDLFTPDRFFLMTHRNPMRLLHAVSIFLTTKHLPANIVSSFLKRFSRLVPWCDEFKAHHLMVEVNNLLVFHSDLDYVVCPENLVEYFQNDDPYSMTEHLTITMRRSFQNSLWELWQFGFWKSIHGPTIHVHPYHTTIEKFTPDVKEYFRNIEIYLFPVYATQNEQP